MLDAFAPTSRPTETLKHQLSNSVKVRLVEEFGGTFIEADFDHVPAELIELLSLLEDIGWHAVPEETEDTVTADGNGARIRVRSIMERASRDY